MNSENKITINHLLEFIQKQTSIYLEKEQSDIEFDTPLSEYGINSVAAVSLCADIEDYLDIDVEPTLAWDFPTIRGMSNHLLTQV